jgi:hypothetical protein
MKFKANMITSGLCMLLLAACSQSEQKLEETTSTSASTSTTSVTVTPDATATSTSTGSDDIYEGTISGVISDSMCGKDHSKMGALGKDPAACIARCVAGGAKYVLVNSKGDSYALSDQEKAKELAAKSVAITGHIDPTEKSVHVHSIVGQ